MNEKIDIIKDHLRQGRKVVFVGPGYQVELSPRYLDKLDEVLQYRADGWYIRRGKRWDYLMSAKIYYEERK